MAKVLLVDLKLFTFLAFISLVIFAFDKFGVLNGPKFLLQFFTVPVQYGLYQSSRALDKQAETFLLVRRSVLENRALRVQVGELLTENSQLQQKLSETESLVDQYNKLNPRTYDMLPARIISSGRFLTLDKGSSDGVQLGQAVVYKDNYIGQVKEVTPKVSRVVLSQDPDSKIAVFSQNGDGRAKGLLEGQFGSETLMDKILHQETVAKGDLVYSEGVEGVLPRGLVMGKVSQVLENQNEIFKQAKVEPVFNIDDLDVVFVIRNP